MKSVARNYRKAVKRYMRKVGGNAHKWRGQTLFAAR